MGPVPRVRCATLGYEYGTPTAFGTDVGCRACLGSFGNECGTPSAFGTLDPIVNATALELAGD
ncbi:hypothetical protein SV7mr_41330 [Stieleria bergensis]|uniref:Uncharacterized protein n=1 Tax=Stieleria bergensis TaxID=2528025 RepID=A0A517SZN2_9BACT|nr:hypothetical protein SV7mr_41330 [Planctomycetes bacterium SV_7m_r]